MEQETHTFSPLGPKGAISEIFGHRGRQTPKIKGIDPYFTFSLPQIKTQCAHVGLTEAGIERCMNDTGNGPTRHGYLCGDHYKVQSANPFYSIEKDSDGEIIEFLLAQDAKAIGRGIKVTKVVTETFTVTYLE